MAVLDDPRTYGRTRLSFADTNDIDEFVRKLDQFERGDISPEEWRRFRLLRGTYGQRQDADAQAHVLHDVVHERAVTGLETISQRHFHALPLTFGVALNHVSDVQR